MQTAGRTNCFVLRAKLSIPKGCEKFLKRVGEPFKYIYLFIFLTCGQMGHSEDEILISIALLL